MIKTFTQNDLIRYLYHETTEEETREIDKALICDTHLQVVYNELRSTMKQLDNAVVEPSSSTVLSILSYARGVQKVDE